jgi:hypothetical protein
MELTAPTTENYKNMYFLSDFTKTVFYIAVNLVIFNFKNILISYFCSLTHYNARAYILSVCFQLSTRKTMYVYMPVAFQNSAYTSKN